MTRIILLWLILFECPTGLWTFDCVFGKYRQDDICKPCPRSCSRCISVVRCTLCKPGFYGNRCLEICSESCGDGKCLQENGQCVFCAVGHYFSSNKTCVKCPEHCTYCQSQGICTACETGFTGSICQEKCTNCNPVSGCNIETKVCFAGCIDGYGDPTCVKRCASNCKSCEPDDASKCTSCVSGRYGANCDHMCPTMCRDFMCNVDNGHCMYGCKEGFWGNMCEKKCSRNCRQEKCRHNDGICSNGCHGNFTGSMCLCPRDCECKSDETCETCSKDSSFVCDRQCSEFCYGGICSFDTQQKCLYGCREGYRGSLCGSSDSPKYSEEESSTSAVVVCVIIAVIVPIIIIVATVRWRKRLYRLICKRSVNYRSGEPDAPERKEMIDREPSESGKETDSMKQIHEKLLEISQSIERKTDKEYQTEWNCISKMFLECKDRTHPGTSETHVIVPHENNQVFVCGEKKKFCLNAFYIEATGRTRATHIACTAESTQVIRTQNRDGSFTVQTAGPTEEYRSCFDLFWMMVWQANCKTIVMLNTVNKKEEEQYWPIKENIKLYGQLLVHCREEENKQDYIIRSFEIKQESWCLQLKQFQYTAWQERGRPTSMANFLEFVKTVRAATSESSGPIIVHGRTGIGQTGTFIALDILMRQVEEMLDNVDSQNQQRIDIKTCVAHLRTQRVSMVETFEQYKFLHQAFARYILNLLVGKGYLQVLD